MSGDIEVSELDQQDFVYDIEDYLIPIVSSVHCILYLDLVPSEFEDYLNFNEVVHFKAVSQYAASRCFGLMLGMASES